MAQERDSKKSANKKDGERRLRLYDRVAAHLASIAKSVAIAVMSLAAVVAILIGWGSVSAPGIGIDLSSGGSTAAGSELQKKTSADQASPLIGELHLYIRPGRVSVCSH